MISDKIGAVVIGRNEGNRLVRCLTSVRANLAHVVYVDSGSIDSSMIAAERIGAHGISLNTEEPFTAARARNAGFAVLKELKPGIQFVQFIDGDCELDKNWLCNALPFIELRDDVAIVCGRRREQHPASSVYNRLCDIEWNTPIGQSSACGGDSLVRTSAFEAVGGFRAQLIAGEEPDLCVRLREKGWNIWRLDADMTYHDANIARFRQWWRRSVRFGFGIMEVSRLHWHSPLGIYKTEVKRAIFWGGVLPALIILNALIFPAVLAAALIYPIQVCRIAVARGITSPGSWPYASLITVAKFAEFQGILTFFWRRLRQRSVELIEYK